jgi:hypothetical protein
VNTLFCRIPRVYRVWLGPRLQGLGYFGGRPAT